MKVINGIPYRRVRTQMGRVLYVKMTENELAERWRMQVTICLSPLLMILAFAWAAGVI